MSISNNSPVTALPKSMATYGRRFLERLKTSTYSVVSAVWVFFVCALILLPDIARFRRQASKTQEPDPNRRPGTIPIHDKGQIYLIQPDGSRTPVSHLYASTQLKAYADVLGAAAVWEKTKLPD